VQRPRLLRVLQQGLDLGGEDQPAVVQAVIQRLHTDTVANQPQFLPPHIPERDRKHAAKFGNTVDAPGFERMQNDFGIRMVRPPAMPPQRLQFTPDLRMVVNLPIERHPEGFIFIGHRLSGRLAQIDDREPAMPQTDPSLRIDP
jgi:hypothetical protein